MRQWNFDCWSCGSLVSVHALDYFWHQAGADTEPRARLVMRTQLVLGDGRLLAEVQMLGMLGRLEPGQAGMKDHVVALEQKLGVRTFADHKVGALLAQVLGEDQSWAYPGGNAELGKPSVDLEASFGLVR